MLSNDSKGEVTYTMSFERLDGARIVVDVSARALSFLAEFMRWAQQNLQTDQEVGWHIEKWFEFLNDLQRFIKEDPGYSRSVN